MSGACAFRALRRSCLLLSLPITALAQSFITGTVLDNGKPVDAASVSATRSNTSVAAEAITDSLGRFRLAPLAPGIYAITVRKVGYRSAERVGVRVGESQTVNLSVALTQAPRQLSTITVLSTPTSIDASTAELSLRLDREFIGLLPTARDASSLIALVPGARTNQLWGGAPGVSNDYQLDGISVNHPGLGGDFLALSVDWIEALDVRGLGAGAEHGNFQGGIINAITRTGTNERRMAFRTNYESAGLTATNFNANEQGVEQAGRREVGGEVSGPIVRDRLFYFAGGQIVGRDMRSPNLTTAAPRDFQPVREEHLNARGLGKLTWRPRETQRVDALVGFAAQSADHAGINGVDDPSATLRTRQPTVIYELGWSGVRSARSAVDVRLAGFNAIESRLGYEGSVVPAVQPVALGREPTFQNSAFDERHHASSASGTVEWRTSRSALRGEHELVVGAEATRGHWGNQRTRNGGVTWRPYTFGIAAFDPGDASTWGTTASEWGGEIRLDSDVSSSALYVQDYIALGGGTRVTLTPGLRYGRWSGSLKGVDAARADGFDPRIGVVWDVTGRNTFALKAHWGRYHQGMFSLFFDRASGGSVYTNRRQYYTAPPISSARTTYTEAQRDATAGFSTYYGEEVLDETGRVENYKQPYVDQAMVGLEKSIGRSWKMEVVYTTRVNRDIVGLIDRNAASNYAVLHNVKVDDQFALDYLRDARGNLLKLPTVYVSNKDLKAVLLGCVGVFSETCPTSIGGYSLADPLEWNPDYVLTTIPGAKRWYDQVTVMLRTAQPRWRGEASLTQARLIGNVAGVTGYGTTGTHFSAGPYAHPNEATNNYGPLPDALELEGKVWLTVKLPYALEGGMLFTHTLGERFAPTFEFEGRYVYHDDLGGVIPAETFRSLLGQSVFMDARGSWHYPSRDVVDFHLEWQSPKAAVVTLDLFNALGSDALTSVNTRLGGQLPDDPSTNFLAGRLRVAPRTLRIGARISR